MSDTIEKNIEHPDKAKVWLSQNHPRQTMIGAIPSLQDMVDHQFNQQKNTANELSLQNDYSTQSFELLTDVTTEHVKHTQETLQQNVETLNENIHAVMNSLQKVHTPNELWQAWLSYSVDSSKRLLQTVDVLKERGDVFIEHELAGAPPVLDYDYDIIMDASEFERPCNYVLLRITPPDGVVTDDANRPYIIIDPRAGHGAGIGGFKHESQVGVALKSGHPVYFVGFKRMPEPNQTIADVTYAEGEFVKEVKKRHPKAQEPVIIGNCQGGWAALILAATNSDIKGPIVMNGAPVSAWSGDVGVNPMRYKAGVNGGTWLSMMSADMSNGIFDGAWLVHNFEQMTPYRNYVGKYYDLYKNPVANRQRFLDFERWWGGFFLMNEAEIRWIVENIFIGNRLARNTGQLETGVNIDLRNVKSPLIVFASNGDDITPPPQALSWILDTYSDEKDVEVCGQRIVYMIHEQVGHLGIFVSSKIANHEHTGIASVMDMIEVLPPGLYELNIDHVEGSGQEKTFAVDFERRTFDELREAIGDYRTDEEMFKAVHRSSKNQTQMYEQTLRPLVKMMSNETSAQFLRTLHPMRLQRSIWSSNNPMATAISNLSQMLTKAEDEQDCGDFVPCHSDEDKPVNSYDIYSRIKLPAIESLQQDNVFLQVEKMFMDSVQMTMNFWRDWQGMQTEMMFFSIWSLPWFRQYGEQEGSRRLMNKEKLHELPKVNNALNQIEDGGFNEAVVRMFILSNIVADNNIDRDQLLRLTEVLTEQEPFAQLLNTDLAEIIHTQTLIVRFAEDKSIDTLATLLKSKPERINAFKLVNYVVGADNSKDATTSAMLNKLKSALKLTDSDIG